MSRRYPPERSDFTSGMLSAMGGCFGIVVVLMFIFVFSLIVLMVAM